MNTQILMIGCGGAGCLKHLLASKSMPDEDSAVEMRRALEDAICGNAVPGHDFMERNFSLRQVLENNLPHWNGLIGDSLKSMPDFNTLANGFLRNMGIDILAKRYSDNGMPRLTVDAVMHDMTCALVRRCRPFVRLDESCRALEETVIMFPEKPCDESTRLLERELSDLNKETRSVIVHPESPGLAFPVLRDRIMVSTTAFWQDDRGLEAVRSLDYWKDPGIRKAMIAAESKDAESYFCKTKQGKKTTYCEVPHPFGYTSPIYVREPDFSENRWRPWMEEDCRDEAWRKESVWVS